MSKKTGPHSFVESAMLQARNISAARYDLPHYIFPKNNFPMDEHLIASVKNSLYMMVFNIERIILRQSDMQSRIIGKSLSYPILIESGLLNDNNILDVALMLFQYQKLSTNNGIKYSKISENLMHNEDANIRKCAQKLSLAHSRFVSLGLGNYFELPPEDLQRLTWRIVATFEVIDKQIDPKMIKATSNWLGEYCEAETIAAASRKLAYLLRDQDINDYWHFKASDTAFFIALLERESGIDRHVIINILADRSALLSGLLFRSVDMPRPEALSNILTIFHTDGDDFHSKIIGQISDEYLNITIEQARDALKTWSREAHNMGGERNV